MCAAIGQNGVLHHHATLGPYNTTHIITFLFTLHNMLIPSDPRNEPAGAVKARYHLGQC